MDDQQQDIYKEPDRGKRGGEDQPLVELTPSQMRLRTWRNSIGFTVFMIVIFGLAAWLIYHQERKSERGDLEDAGEESLLIPRSMNERVQAPILAAPKLLEFTESSLDSAQDGPPEVDGQRMAQAMGELRIANEYLMARDYDQAEARVRKALSIWPDMNAALRMLGVIYTQRGQFDQAILALERALKTNPFSAETLNNLATAYMHRDEMTKAEELLQTSLQIRPGYSVAHQNLGLLYLATAQYEAAVDYLERALADLPGETTARNNLAVALLRLGRYKESRQNLHVLIEQSPETAAAYFNMAITFTHERNFPEALDWIRKGAQHCSPVNLQKFLADSDFDKLRNDPELQGILKEIHPELPAGPGNERGQRA